MHNNINGLYEVFHINFTPKAGRNEAQLSVKQTLTLMPYAAQQLFMASQEGEERLTKVCETLLSEMQTPKERFLLNMMKQVALKKAGGHLAENKAIKILAALSGRPSSLFERPL